MRARARTSRRGGLATAVIVLVLAQLAQLGALAHEATVRHVRCAEHGELVDAVAIAAHTEGDARLVDVVAGTLRDDHCLLASALRPLATAPATPSLATTHVARATWASALPLAPTTTAALYLIAPKTSPPRCPVSVT